VKQNCWSTIIEKLKAVIPNNNSKLVYKRNYGKFIARDDISAYRKDVTARYMVAILQEGRNY